MLLGGSGVVTLPSVTAAASDTETVGVGSSSVIVPVPSSVFSPPVSLALVGEDSLTTTVSSGSSMRSPFTVTETVSLVSPGLNVIVPSLKAA